jgi:hypothetical protein
MCVHVCHMRRRIPAEHSTTGPYQTVASPGTQKYESMRRRIHVCHMRRRIHVCHMRRRIHVQLAWYTKVRIPKRFAALVSPPPPPPFELVKPGPDPSRPPSTPPPLLLVNSTPPPTFNIWSRDVSVSLLSSPEFSIILFSGRFGNRNDRGTLPCDAS